MGTRVNMSLVAVFVLACLADPGNYADVTVLECGALSVGGNTIVLYGVEPIDCAAVENALRGWLKDHRVGIQSGGCWLHGEGEHARFTGICDEPDDQYFSDRERQYESSWVIPNSISTTLEPIRSTEQSMTANVWIADQNLQLRLVRDGLVKITCTPQNLQFGSDTCENLLQVANLAVAPAKMSD